MGVGRAFVPQTGLSGEPPGTDISPLPRVRRKPILPQRYSTAGTGMPGIFS